jgi:DNA-binding ferritin-like protein
MESLIIEIYIYNGRHHEIQNDGVFLGLEKLIAHVRADRKLTLGRNTPKTMTDVKQVGDTAAHDRVYITSKQDIDDLLTRYRRMLQDLLASCGIRK